MTSGFRPGPRSRAKSHLATETVRRPRPKGGGAVPFATLFWRLPWLRSLLLLTPPLAWFVVIYFASLILLLITAFWTTDPFTTQIVQVWTTSNFERLINEPVYHDIVGRTVVLAALVTLTDALLAFPFAYYMARLASRRIQTLLFAAVLLPLWASYIARVYAWILIFTRDGVLNWSLAKLGLGPVTLAYTNTAMWIVFSYIWLPFMILPAYAPVERLPHSYVEVAADVGRRGWRSLRDVILPLALPGIVAGSIFTFSLTLG